MSRFNDLRHAFGRVRAAIGVYRRRGSDLARELSRLAGRTASFGAPGEAGSTARQGSSPGASERVDAPERVEPLKASSERGHHALRVLPSAAEDARAPRVEGDASCATSIAPRSSAPWAAARSRPPQPLKVVLYNPKALFFTMPLGLLAIGSHLDPERFRFVLIDGRLESDPIGRLLEELDGALCLGVSVLTGDPIRDALLATRAAKAKRPDLPIIWGGWHPSLFAKECLEERSIDLAVAGQGEDTFREIMERLASGSSLESIAGTVARLPGGGIQLNPPRAFIDINEFRAHDYGAIPVERYFGLKKQRQLDYISSQGCHFRCTFCADPYVYKRKWTGLDPERVGQDLERAFKTTPFEDCHFQDETFFTYSRRVAGIAEEILRRRLPITWAATMRADQGCRLPEGVFALARRSGLRKVIIGLESGDPEMLLWLKKDTTVEQVIQSGEMCARHGVQAEFPTIVGFPGETAKSVAETMKVAKKLRALHPSFRVPIFYYKPYPGTPITDRVTAEGYRLPASLDEWANFDFIGSAGPWVDPLKYQRIERFKFYLDRAWGRSNPLSGPFRTAARWRLEKDRYELPVEKWLMELFRPPMRLS